MFKNIHLAESEKRLFIGTTYYIQFYLSRILKKIPISTKVKMKKLITGKKFYFSLFAIYKLIECEMNI